MSSLDWDSPTLRTYVPPVALTVFPTASVALLTAAFLLASLFFINQVSATKYSRSLVKDLAIAVPASLLFGFGFVSLFLACGIYL
ncbi:hypothetical protein BDZ88DRAFT_407489 [Geranomyces variabilis]|nr:hypothetical protein BDZ88DRAFT_407489 [Geranomyces variabilis]KAJ3142432.1 hypothetical protein HDU90_004706 [Geranomyces variabilis]